MYFSFDMNRWMNQEKGWMYEERGGFSNLQSAVYQMFTSTEVKLKNSKEYLDKMGEFIRKRSSWSWINREEAESYLPSLISHVRYINPDHSVLVKIEEMRKNLLSPNATTLEDLPPEILFFIWQKKESLKNWKKLSSVNHFFHSFMKDPSILKCLLEKHGDQIPLKQKIDFAFLTKDRVFSLDFSRICYEYLRKEHLEYLGHLTHLRIGGHCNIKINKAVSLCAISSRYLTNLQSLDISEYGYGWTNEFFEPLSHLTSLNMSIDLPSPNQGNKAFKYLTNLQSLRIATYRADLTNDFLEPLSHLTALHIINSRDLNIKDQVSKSFTNLQDLSIEFCKDLSDEFLKPLIHLKSLKIGQNDKITNEAFKYLTALQSLKIGFCGQLTSEFLKPLTHLQSLTMRNPDDFLTDQSFNYLTNVQYLKISWCKNFTDEFLKPLTNLQSLKIFRCKCEFTSETLKRWNITSLWNGS